MAYFLHPTITYNAHVIEIFVVYIPYKFFLNVKVYAMQK